jgi:hypothetical protein
LIGILFSKLKGKKNKINSKVIKKIFKKKKGKKQNHPNGIMVSYK